MLEYITTFVTSNLYTIVGVVVAILVVWIVSKMFLKEPIGDAFLGIRTYGPFNPTKTRKDVKTNWIRSEKVVIEEKPPVIQPGRQGPKQAKAAKMPKAAKR